MSIFMSKFAGDDYSAMQGPCPEGYHVPNKDEWSLVKTRLTELGMDTSNGNCMLYLKIPKSGIRYYDSASNASQGSVGYYWSSSPKSDNRYAYCLIFSSSQFSENSMNRSNGEMIRPFKDTSVTPTSSWTKLYGTSIESGGIFWSSTDGLISLSSDGNSRLTIADKNLGATTTYNGDALSEANCGKYYQRGNGYGFPYAGGSFVTSSTKVDASNYGPGNYYSGSTFIISSSSPYDRSSVQNDNLWGGVTGVVQNTGEPKKIYIRVEAQPITTSGIYHNPDLGLISLSSDGSTWITIADKNLGATQVWNSGDTTSETNCGNFYQWGNNYGFPFAGTFTKSTGRVNASTYGPGNYYSGTTFYYQGSSPYTWDSSSNADLWGGTTGTNIARRGPCDEGYHIPSKQDFDNIVSIFTSLGITQNMSNVETYLKLTNRKEISPSNGNYSSVNYVGIWLSDNYADDYGSNVIANTAGIYTDNYSWKCMGKSIRPFKNEARPPYQGETGWTKLN